MNKTNTVYWMGLEITSDIPKELMIKLLNLMQKDPQLFKEFTEWSIPEMNRRIKNN